MPDYKASAIFALFLFAFVAVAITSCPYCARADDRLPLPDPQVQLQPGKLFTLEGVRGRWWPLETAMVLAAEHEQYAELTKLHLACETANELLHQRIEEKDSRILNLMTMVDVTKERAEHAESAISHAEKVAAKERARAEKARVWWKNPGLWFIVGVAAGGTAAVVARR